MNICTTSSLRPPRPVTLEGEIFVTVSVTCLPPTRAAKVKVPPIFWAVSNQSTLPLLSSLFQRVTSTLNLYVCWPQSVERAETTATVH